MKTIKFALALLLFTSITTFAQAGRNKEKMEQVKSLKVAFITNELALTAEESSKFWPIYNAFQEKQKEIRSQKVSTQINRRDNASLEQMTDKEATVLLAQMENNEEQLYQLRKKLNANLKGILPAIKIIKLKKAEEDFNRKLLQQYRKKSQRK